MPKTKIIKKIFFATLAVGLLLGATWFVARKTANPILVTTKYGSISQAAYYQKIKATPEAQNVLRAVTLEQILVAKYGHKVTEKMVDASYKNSRAMYNATDWKKALQQGGYTPASYKAQIKRNLIERVAIEANVKITDADLQKQFKNYYPNVTVADIMVGDKQAATKVIQQLKAGKSFAQVLAANSLDTRTNGNHGIMPVFNSASVNVDPAIKKVAFTLKNNQISSKPIKGSDGYYVIKMISNPGKGSMSQYKGILTTEIINDYVSGANGRSALPIYQRLYGQSKVVVKDKALTSVNAFVK